jgi:hypothetical protein
MTNFASGFTGGNIGNSGSGGYRGGQIAAANSGAFQCKPILKIPTKKTKPTSLTKILSAGERFPIASDASCIKETVTLITAAVKIGINDVQIFKKIVAYLIVGMFGALYAIFTILIIVGFFGFTGERFPIASDASCIKETVTLITAAGKIGIRK